MPSDLHGYVSLANAYAAVNSISKTGQISIAGSLRLIYKTLIFLYCDKDEFKYLYFEYARMRARKLAIPHDKSLHRQRHCIENMFGRLKDWRRIAARYDRCADFFSRPAPSPPSRFSGCES
jgi:transposase